jgi:DNA-binding transcriptional regulator YiaG
MNLVKTVRLQMGMKQKQFAHLLGVSHYTICRWEHGALVPERVIRCLLLAPEVFELPPVPTNHNEFYTIKMQLGANGSELAALFGVTGAAVSHWNVGARPVPPNIIRLMRWELNKRLTRSADDISDISR